jgi:hypothetical protein
MEGGRYEDVLHDTGCCDTVGDFAGMAVLGF